MSILDKNNKEHLINLYKEITINARFLVDKIWSSIKFFISILSALITFTLATFLTNVDHLKINKLYLIPILIIIICLSLIAILNSFREYKHYLEYIVVIDKLQELLGLNEKIKLNRFPDDKYLLPSRFILKNYRNSDEFIKKNTFRKGNLLCYIVLIYSLFMTMSIVILLIIIF